MPPAERVCPSPSLERYKLRHPEHRDTRLGITGINAVQGSPRSLCCQEPRVLLACRLRCSPPVGLSYSARAAEKLLAFPRSPSTRTCSTLRRAASRSRLCPPPPTRPAAARDSPCSRQQKFPSSRRLVSPASPLLCTPRQAIVFPPLSRPRPCTTSSSSQASRQDSPRTPKSRPSTHAPSRDKPRSCADRRPRSRP